jgi:capsular polysaccharide biosynthesis protein
MELRALWKIVVRRWWLIALPGLATVAVAAYGYVKAPPRGGFTTSVRYTAATPPTAEQAANPYEDSLYYPWLTSEYVINGLTDWVRTGSFAQDVSDELAAQGVEIPAAAIQGSISADNARSIMVLTLSWGDAAQLAQISQAATAALQQHSADTFPQFGDAGVEVVALDTPGIAPVPPPLTARLEPLVRVALGVAAGVALAFLVEYLDPTLHARQDVEAMGIAVLAEVPKKK